VSSFQDRLRNIVSRAAAGGDTPLLGDAKIIPYEQNNSLLVFATKHERQMIKDIVAKLDVVQAQVLIEAIIVEVSLSDDLGYGVSMSQNGHSADRFTGAVGSIQGTKNAPFSFIDPTTITSLSTNIPGGFSYFGSVGRDFDFVLKAAASDSRVNILSRPRIQTSHAIEAELFDGQSRPFPTGTYQTYGGLNQTQTQQQQIGIRLNILPLINQDGLVVLDISQTIQSLGDDITIDKTSGFVVPAVIDRQASSRVAVQDGDTIMLGGMIRNEKRNSRSGVPLLQDIPLLGKLFSSKSKTDSKQELLVFIRPTVLATPEAAAFNTKKEEEQMIDVKQAQYEIMRDEALRRKKMEADLRRQREEDLEQPRK
ncbi:MAG: type II secretion system protein GspD, partial [Pedosphaera parvula]|nr:type II secretion system protein GspD [Pedosphaera parvula]